MSTSLAIAKITEYLRREITAAVNPGENDDSISITVGPPDKARGDRTDRQLNLFLYQVLPDAAWRNRDLPGKVKAGERAPPVLALRLGYLLTAFSPPPGPQDPGDSLGHVLLGNAMRRLHDRPELPRNLEPESPAVEPARATLQPLSLDEMSKVWSGLQSPYRVTVAYEVSPVLIESTKPTASAPPVLSRGESPAPGGGTVPDDPGFGAGPGVPTAEITRLRFPPGQAGVRLGDELVIEGRGLEAVNLLELRHSSLPVTHTAVPTFDAVRQVLRWRVPNTVHDANDTSDPPRVLWPAGLWAVACGRTSGPNGRRAFTTAPFPFALLPEIVLDAGERPTLVVGPDQGISVTLPLRPRVALKKETVNSVEEVRVAQRVTLLAGDRDLPLTARAVDPSSSDPIGAVEFSLLGADVDALRKFLKEGPHGGPLYVRVRVDGADSSLLRLPFDPQTSPREYDPNLILVVP